jgi:hypothetical protein
MLTTPKTAFSNVIRAEQVGSSSIHFTVKTLENCICIGGISAPADQPASIFPDRYDGFQQKFSD